MTPAQVARGMLDTFDAAVWVLGFVFLVALLGGFVDLRLSAKWKLLRESRWRKLYR